MILILPPVISVTSGDPSHLELPINLLPSYIVTTSDYCETYLVPLSSSCCCCLAGVTGADTVSLIDDEDVVSSLSPLLSPPPPWIGEIDGGELKLSTVSSSAHLVHR